MYDGLSVLLIKLWDVYCTDHSQTCTVLVWYPTDSDFMLCSVISGAFFFTWVMMSGMYFNKTFI